ncbi:MAG TPA: HDIG domain-containing protein [Bacteroidales bacterium]|nr:HDIG domain-containing protein [Bacteroidales bacterium]HPR58005.1 HDIG domain-containing protein [Bacteroidales bacterium]HRW96644.1 HDIG domain-containing protein [Bacteroidales bacterium]
MMTENIELLEKYFTKGSLAHHIIMQHSKSVAELALKIAKKNPHLDVNLSLLEQGAMLHDIGIIKTNAPDLDCNGEYPYICHGWLGREILEAEGFPEIAPFCERHTGTGISLDEIIRYNLPLPHREMMPVTTEEMIVCYADKFFSKSGKNLTQPKKLKKIYASLHRYGEDKLRRFDEFIGMFGIYYINGWHDDSPKSTYGERLIG